MPDQDAFLWFKTTFKNETEPALRDTPFSLDLLAAIAAQETGHIWSSLRHRMSVTDLLEVCVGDTLDEDHGRRAFPRNKQQLLSVPNGQAMFEIGHEALVNMAKVVAGFSGAASRPDKFCHAYGIFQCDLQLFRTDPSFFLDKQWRRFDVCLRKCLAELQAAAKRIGLGNRSTLTNLDQIHIAIAYNAGTFRPERGLKQGFFDGKQFYGELISEFLGLSQSAVESAVPATPLRVQPAAALSRSEQIAT